MSEPFRFLHMSDLRLGEPISGVRQPSPELRQRLLDAPYDAVEQALDAAIREKVEFVLLTGNALDLHQPSPKPLSFLQKQFRRLLKEGIEVYWCTGPLDPAERWPAALELPENVTVFSASSVEVAKIQNDRGAVCTLLAAGAQTEIEAVDFRAVSDGSFVIGAVNGLVDLTQLSDVPCQYWALGGRRHRSSVAIESRLALYPGSPQSRSPMHRGACGVNLVAVDAGQSIHSKEIACDSLRFLHHELNVENLSHESLKERLSEATLEIAAEIEERWIVVDWTISLVGEESGAVATDKQVEHLVQWLRKEFAGRHGGVWCNGVLIADVAEQLPKSLLEEDSILGDFLRSLPDWEDDPDRLIDLASLLELPAEWNNSPFREALLHYDRADLLTRVRKLGLELLSGSATP